MEEGPAIDLAVDASGWDTRYQGSKYIYMTYASSGSSPRVLTQVTASRYDVWDPIQPIIRTTALSERSSPGDYKYQKDIWNYKAFSNIYTSSIKTLFTSSEAAQTSVWTRNYGLQISGGFSTDPFWIISGSKGGLDDETFNVYGAPTYNGINYQNAFSGTKTGSFLIDAFFDSRDTDDHYKNDTNTTNIKYRITGTIKCNSEFSPIDGVVTFQAGKEGSAFSYEFPHTTTAPNSVTVPFNFITRADGHQLVVTSRISQTNQGGTVCIKDLKVQPLNYYASVQDFHLWDSAGMVNARYNGCKLTSTDYNVDSPDTVDGGPVITITEGGGKILKAQPTKQKGTFEIL